jgi:hypothetical protein
MSFSPAFTIVNRQSEWQAALAMLGAALVIALFPSAVSNGGFTALMLCAIFFMSGCLRAASLYANGNWPVWGRVMRVLAAIVGALLWLQMALSQVMWSYPLGYVTIDVPVYVVLALGEFVTIYRIMADGRPH